MTESWTMVLVNWYKENKRILPWRKTRNPYFIWISEVMLQQTQVDTVIPYYERFITRFPTMYDLARADEDVLLKEWEGLGYYSRARNLQAGVREVTERYGGIVPRTKRELLNVKGIGPYTAGAILSIAYNEPEPAVDGNVMRVISRLFRIEEDIAKAKTRRLIEDRLRPYMPADQAGEFNQALMELGALICKPKNPLCHECPIASFCRAYKEDVQTKLPIKLKKQKTKLVRYAVLVLQSGEDRFYIQKRPSEGLLAGLWEFPMFEIKEGADEVNFKARFLKSKPVRTSMKVKHIFSHLKWELTVFYGYCGSEETISRAGKWVTRTALSDYAFPVPHQKIIHHLDRVIP
ncbi:A/G-specific adenine glycosylase [Tuberibacillus calidus]|uniref:A/G-specific adenine glycosylase n=1 Tax=Tuberibacillus calidus TaxID=340097 RepID=UPI00042583C0|nr:A/G-specific adenine glycosylase [Tuberibacillus calidus]